MKTVSFLLFLMIAPCAGSGRTTAAASDPGIEHSARVSRIATRAEALRYLGGADSVTLQQFQEWSGVAPTKSPAGQRWRLADGVLLTNCLILDNGTNVISCWRRA